MQGRTDIPLSERGRTLAARWRLPRGLADATWFSSPLARTLETARILRTEPTIETCLIETDWGDWEGKKWADIRRSLGRTIPEDEDYGLDFRPPGGESPRMVQDRIRPWLSNVSRAGEPAVAVTHKGIVKAIMALATGWTMTGKAPVNLEPNSCHRFLLDKAGLPEVEQMNIAMVREP